MSFQKGVAPPGIYDGTCAIAKSTKTWIVDCIGLDIQSHRPGIVKR
jgi:hypothetical protein